MRNTLASLPSLAARGKRIGRISVVALLAATAPALAQEDAADQQPTASAILEQAREWEINTCADAIGLISDFLTASSIYDSLHISGPENPDQEMFSASIALEFPNENANGWATMSVAPVAGGGCNVAYTLVETFEETCEQTRETYFSVFTAEGDFGQSAGILSYENEGVHLSLMPAVGGGCVSMRQEFLY